MLLRLLSFKEFPQHAGFETWGISLGFNLVGNIQSHDVFRPITCERKSYVLIPKQVAAIVYDVNANRSDDLLQVNLEILVKIFVPATSLANLNQFEFVRFVRGKLLSPMNDLQYCRLQNSRNSGAALRTSRFALCPANPPVLQAPGTGSSQATALRY